MTGKDIGISPIKLKNKNSLKELDEIFEEIQNEIYLFGLLLYTTSVKQYMLDKLTDAGTRLNNVSISRGNEGQIRRKMELLQVLREYYHKLKSYYPVDKPDNIERMCKFLVCMYLKDKENREGEEFYLEWLRKLHKLSTFYTFNKSLSSVYDEIINYFKINQICQKVCGSGISLKNGLY